MIKKAYWSKVSGRGEQLFLIHGMGSSSSVWQTIAPGLESNFQVVLLDLPGHGNTPLLAENKMDPYSLGLSILEIADAYGFEKFHVAGNSLGGWAGLELAAARPERVASLTALAPAGLWLAPYNKRLPGTASSRMLAAGLRDVAPKLLKYEWARQIGFKSVSPKWRDLSVDLCIDAAIAMGTSTGYYSAWDAMLGKRFNKQISPNIPVTVIFGDTDNTLPVKTSQERSLLPDHAKWLVLPDSGHAPMWDHPDEVISEIIATAKLAK
jgi:pimeloyl-ACP methyl ester carboxylesterase